MGLNLIIERLDGTQHPFWDTLRMVGDRRALELVCSVETINEPGYDAWVKGDAPCFRPANPADLDALTWPEENPERWVQLRTILRDPNWWLYASV